MENSQTSSDLLRIKVTKIQEPIESTMEIEKMDFDSFLSIPPEKSFSGESKSGRTDSVFEEVKGKPEVSDGFVALDIESLSLLAAASASSPIVNASEKDSIAGKQDPLKKTLSKKGSQRGGDIVAAATDRESLSVLIHVASDGDTTALPPEKTPTVAAVGAGSRNRRIAGRRHGQRLDPRRVVVLFATMSSMGTLILLYFTLSLGKMTADNTNAR